jgi:hypothetical protein
MFQKAIHFPPANSERELDRCYNKPCLHAATQSSFTIFRNVSTTFSKILKKRQNKQLAIHKQQTNQYIQRQNKQN